MDNFKDLMCKFGRINRIFVKNWHIFFIEIFYFSHKCPNLVRLVRFFDRHSLIFLIEMVNLSVQRPNFD